MVQKLPEPPSLSDAEPRMPAPTTKETNPKKANELTGQKKQEEAWTQQKQVSRERAFSGQNTGSTNASRGPRMGSNSVTRTSRQFRARNRTPGHARPRPSHTMRCSRGRRARRDTIAAGPSIPLFGASLREHACSLPPSLPGKLLASSEVHWPS
jgi:hypothetical protein